MARITRGKTGEVDTVTLMTLKNSVIKAEPYAKRNEIPFKFPSRNVVIVDFHFLKIILSNR